GMVWGVEMRDHAGRSAAEWANEVVLSCYRGEGGDGIHLLGPLARKVLRIAPPLVITEQEAAEAMRLMHKLTARLRAAVFSSSAWPPCPALGSRREILPCCPRAHADLLRNTSSDTLISSSLHWQRGASSFPRSHVGVSGGVACLAPGLIGRSGPSTIFSRP